jgi:hypothetical protein
MMQRYHSIMKEKKFLRIIFSNRIEQKLKAMISLEIYHKLSITIIFLFFKQKKLKCQKVPSMFLLLFNTTCHIIKTVWIKVKRHTLNKKENYDFMRSL